MALHSGKVAPAATSTWTPLKARVPGAVHANFIVISASIANTSSVFVGDSTAVDLASGNEIQPGGSVTFPAVASTNAYCLSEIGVVIQSAGDKVGYNYVTR